jgi:hypothetical protein
MVPNFTELTRQGDFTNNFVGPAVPGRDIEMHPEMGQKLVSLHSRVCGVHYGNISYIIKGFTMLTTLCFQFHMSNTSS